MPTRCTAAIFTNENASVNSARVTLSTGRCKIEGVDAAVFPLVEVEWITENSDNVMRAMIYSKDGEPDGLFAGYVVSHPVVVVLLDAAGQAPFWCREIAWANIPFLAKLSPKSARDELETNNQHLPHRVPRRAKPDRLLAPSHRSAVTSESSFALSESNESMSMDEMSLSDEDVGVDYQDNASFVSDS
tara:strand:+ start:1181 stop:1744 length:564 start_codon:yes stop_codon:yes gene_type:complete